MLKFAVLDSGGVAKGVALDHSYLIGSDNNAIRANISFKDGVIVCQKRESGAAAIALLYDAGACGQLVLRTCLLGEREEPYLLSLELARRRLILFYNKLEDWSMFETSLDEAVVERFDIARQLFIEALCDQHDDPFRADRLARKCLVNAIGVSEALALVRADRVLTRRLASGMIPKYPIGCRVGLEHIEHARVDLLANMNLVCLPTPWRDLEPLQGQYRWDPVDQWAAWLGRHRIAMFAGPIVDFDSRVLPEWLTARNHDYETIRDLAYEHTERIVSRYRNMIGVWNVISGVQINSLFGFNFEQLMELSRMTTMLVKKIQPTARSLVEIRHPFGEYYSVNQRSIPPLMYADLLMQSAVAFDGFVVKILMGGSAMGYQARDLTQISHLLDQFAGYGKPVTVVVAVPGGSGSAGATARATKRAAKRAPNPIVGYWRSPWSPQVQGHWLESVYKIALSKTYVDAVVWERWIDGPEPGGGNLGLIDSQFKPKNAFYRLVGLSHKLGGDSAATRAASSSVEGPQSD